MLLQLQNFPTLVGNAAAAAQAECASLSSFEVGSPERALMEADAAQALWLQWLILLVLSTTRLSTSSGPDVDSFVGDYGLTRLPAVPASGAETFSRNSTTVAATIVPYFNADGSVNPSGAVVTTVGAGQGYGVAVDTTNGFWSPSALAYVVPIGTASATVPIQAILPGSGSNVFAHTITLLATATPYIDTVTNAAPLATGENAETDAALKARFALYIASLSRATILAVEAAVASVQQGLTDVVTENSPANGFFTVTVDDGTGSPSDELLVLVYAAVDAVRPVTVSFAVHGPTLHSANIAITLTIPSSVNRAPVDAAVAAAVGAFIAALPVGHTLALYALAATIFNASPQVQNAVVTINSVAADLNPGPTGVVRIGTLTVA